MCLRAKSPVRIKFIRNYTSYYASQIKCTIFFVMKAAYNIVGQAILYFIAGIVLHSIFGGTGFRSQIPHKTIFEFHYFWVKDDHSITQLRPRHTAESWSRTFLRIFNIKYKLYGERQRATVLYLSLCQRFCELSLANKAMTKKQSKRHRITANSCTFQKSLPCHEGVREYFLDFFAMPNGECFSVTGFQIPSSI